MEKTNCAWEIEIGAVQKNFPPICKFFPMWEVLTMVKVLRSLSPRSMGASSINGAFVATSLIKASTRYHMREEQIPPYVFFHKREKSGLFSFFLSRWCAFPMVGWRGRRGAICRWVDETDPLHLLPTSRFSFGKKEEKKRREKILRNPTRWKEEKRQNGFFTLPSIQFTCTRARKPPFFFSSIQSNSNSFGLLFNLYSDKKRPWKILLTIGIRSV